MKLESRFDLGQAVWVLNIQHKDTFTECPSCVGGNIPLQDGRQLKCPRCNEKGVISERSVLRWGIGQPLTIGQIRLCVGGSDDDKEQYMCRETGVGSGTIHNGCNLFGSLEAAQTECDKRNLEAGRAWMCVNCNPEFEPVQYRGWNEWRTCYVHGHTNHLDEIKANDLLRQHKENLNRLNEDSP